ncbi:hypothetical protein CACET_c13020 [Clostridium aceticum]|uniref:Uncharacterized protein n=1 Tax=Clostridium aceticum TaxID=84022 RepID=A0A0G3WA30_9CLOT|nr:hypothetical protein [Clostridium aceticum]AKL94767.1 hypothetical protein CACET_c13020 [Clostridium aceticum]
MDSKYYKTWEEYKAACPEINEALEAAMAPKVQKYEDALFNFILSLVL